MFLRSPGDRIVIRGLKLSIVGLLAGFTTFASAADIRGILMDQKCSSQAQVRLVPGGRLMGGLVVAEAHTKQCALMPECQKSGYGVFTYDEKFLTFDAAGNRKAIALLKTAKQLDNLEVEVTGDVQGDTIKVENLKLVAGN